MPFLSPEAKSEEAFRLYLESIRTPDLEGVQFLKRFDADIQRAAFVTIVAESVGPAFDYSDSVHTTFRVGMLFKLVSHNKDNTGTQHDTYVAGMADNLSASDVTTTLNTLMTGESFYAQLWTPGERTNDVDGNVQITEIRGQLIMLPQDIA